MYRYGDTRDNGYYFIVQGQVHIRAPKNHLLAKKQLNKLKEKKIDAKLMMKEVKCCETDREDQKGN